MIDRLKYERFIQELGNSNQLRSLKNLSFRNGIEVKLENKKYLNFSSNDYLGIAFDEGLHREFYKQMDDKNRLESYGLGSSSSRLLTGNNSAYTNLETKLSKLYQRESALVFNSGYHANIGIIPALSTKKDLILSDKLNHASMIDGLRLSEAKVIRYRHFDYKQLERILIEQRDNYDQIFIMSESVFSMDGDLVDLKKLIELRNKYNAILYIDEAHAVGVRGEQGLGLAEEENYVDQIDLLVGTFGKAIASQGAYVICDKVISQYLVNTMRSLIFTTALPPVSVSWLEFIFERLPGMTEQRKHLSKLSKYMRDEIKKVGFEMKSSSNIIPIMLGKNKDAEAMSLLLQENGFLSFAIRPPTVPQNTARLRLSLTANMEISQLEKLVSLIKGSI